MNAAAALRGALAILAKDLTIELRTREIVTTTGFFAVLVAVLASIAFTGGAAYDTRVAPGAIWISVAFSSVLALGRTWQREREESALLGLLVTPLPRAGLFLGKATGVFAFLTVVEVAVVLVVALVFHVDLLKVLGPLVALLALGTVGVAAAGTLFGVMTVRTRARDLVVASVLFPLLSPALMAGIAGTREVFEGATLAEVRDYLVLLTTFDGVFLLGGVTLFGSLVDD